MKSDFKLVGLSKDKSITCEPLQNENTFWPDVKMEQDRFNALFSWAENEKEFWNSKLIAEIEHDGLYPDATPIHPVLVGVRYWDL